MMLRGQKVTALQSRIFGKNSTYTKKNERHTNLLKHTYFFIATSRALICVMD